MSILFRFLSKIVLVLLVSQSLLAAIDYSQFSDLDHFTRWFIQTEGREPTAPETALARVVIENIRKKKMEISEIFHQNGYHHPGAEIVAQIYEILRKENNLSISNHQRIISIAQGLLRFDGRSLQRRKSCFTCSMRVLTPEGYREIGDLVVGDKVVSWDFDNNMPIVTEVLQVHEAENVEYGELTSDMFPRGALEVTPDHPLYSYDDSQFIPVSQLSDNSRIASIQSNQCSGLFSTNLNLGRRGQFQLRGFARVRTISVSGKFQNYFVEGILVRNKPIHITWVESLRKNNLYANFAQVS